MAPLSAADGTLGAEVWAAAALFIGDPDRRAVEDVARLAGLFNLTRAEALAAGYVVNGEQLADLAETLSITIGTVRGHVKRILPKTGVKTQAQFVTLVLHGPASMW